MTSFAGGTASRSVGLCNNGLSHKYSAACSGRIKFHETPILLILLRKINKIGVSEEYSLATNDAK
jgi:hypothetical protein